MKTWLVNFSFVSIGTLLSLVLVFQVIRLKRVYHFVARLLLGLRDYTDSRSTAMEDYKAAIQYKPSCIRQIALSDHRLIPQDLAALYVYAADSLLCKSTSIAVKYYTEAIKLDPESADAYSKRANCYRQLQDWTSQLADYTQAASLYQQQGNLEEAKRVTQEIDRASAQYQRSLKPKTFQPVSGKIFDAQSWQPLNDEQVLVLTGTRSPETIVDELNLQPSLDPIEVTVELYWRTYSVPIAAVSESEKVGYLGYLVHQGQRLTVDEEITSTYAGYRGDWERHYQATDLELFCFNYVIEGLRGNDWHNPEAYLPTLQLTWEPTSQIWVLSTSNHRSGSVYNTSVWTSYESSIRFDLQNLRAYYRARFYCDATD